MNRDLELLYELGSLRHTSRSWTQHLGVSTASDLEHMMRVAFLALMLARREGQGDEGLILKMALTHDLAETRTGDQNYVQSVYVDAKEEQAVHDTLENTSLSDLEDIITLYQKRDCIEAKLVKDADNLDVDLEMKELAAQGHTLPGKWASNRQAVAENKLHTQAAKDFWQEIQTSDPHSWHFAANKWNKIPGAGR